MERKSMICSSFVYHADLHFNCAISFCKATSDDAFLRRMAFSALRVCTSLSSDVTRCRIPWSVSAWASQHSEAEPPNGFCGRTGTNTCTIAATRRSPAIIVKNSYILWFLSLLSYQCYFRRCYIHTLTLFWFLKYNVRDNHIQLIKYRYFSIIQYSTCKHKMPDSIKISNQRAVIMFADIRTILQELGLWLVGSNINVTKAYFTAGHSTMALWNQYDVCLAFELRLYNICIVISLETGVVFNLFWCKK